MAGGARFSLFCPPSSSKTIRSKAQVINCVALKSAHTPPEQRQLAALGPASVGRRSDAAAGARAPGHAHFLRARRRSRSAPGKPDALSVAASAPAASLATPLPPLGPRQDAPRGWLCRCGTRGSWARTATARGGGAAPRRWGPGALLHAGDPRGGACGTCPPEASPFSCCCCSSASSSGEDRRKKR